MEMIASVHSMIELVILFFLFNEIKSKKRWIN